MKLSQSAADILNPVNILTKDEKSFEQNYENIRKQVEATFVILETPEIQQLSIMNALKTSFEKNCEWGECTKVTELISERITWIFGKLKDKAANNSTYRPADEQAA